jgi:hypothetical protein
VLGCLRFGVVHASKEVSGVIDSATVWKKVDSPFDLTGPVLVSEGAVLTITAGVTVNLNGYYIQVDGILSARGTVSDKIYFLGGSSEPSKWAITFTTRSVSWDERDGSGCVLENVVVEGVYGGVSINSAAPRVDSSVISGDLAVDVFGGSVVISNNTIVGEVGVRGGSSPHGSAAIVGNNITGCIMAADAPYQVVIANNTIVAGGNETGLSGILCSNARVYDNVVYGFAMGAGISMELGWDTGSVIERNLVVYNLVGINVSRAADPAIRYNMVAKNSVGIVVNRTASPSIHYNNIQDNSQNSVYLYETGDVNATDNWWGTTETAAINQSIYDFKNNFNFGKVTFVPFLTEPEPTAPSLSSAPEPTPTPTPSGSPEPSSTLSDFEIAIVVLLVVIAGLLVAVLVLLLRKRR